MDLVGQIYVKFGILWLLREGFVVEYIFLKYPSSLFEFYLYSFARNCSVCTHLHCLLHHSEWLNTHARRLHRIHSTMTRGRRKRERFNNGDSIRLMACKSKNSRLSAARAAAWLPSNRLSPVGSCSLLTSLSSQFIGPLPACNESRSCHAMAAATANRV